MLHLKSWQLWAVGHILLLRVLGKSGGSDAGSHLNKIQQMLLKHKAEQLTIHIFSSFMTIIFSLHEKLEWDMIFIMVKYVSHKFTILLLFIYF